MWLATSKRALRTLMLASFLPLCHMSSTMIKVKRPPVGVACRSTQERGLSQGAPLRRTALAVYPPIA